MKPSYDKKLGKVTYNEQKIPLDGIVPTGTLEITENRTYDVTEYAEVNVNVESGGGVIPAGELTINYNGTHDVTNYESAKVDVPPYQAVMHLESRGLRFNIDNYSEDFIEELNYEMPHFPFTMITTEGFDIFDIVSFRDEFYYMGVKQDIYINRIIITDALSFRDLSSSSSTAAVIRKFFSMFEYPVYFNGENIASLSQLINKLKNLEEGVEYYFDTEQLIKQYLSVAGFALYGTNTRLRKVYHYGSSSSGQVGQAFVYNKYIERVDFDARVKSIASMAHQECTGIKTIVCLSQTPPTMTNKNAFENVLYATLYVPIGCVDAYASATNWSAVISENNWVILELDENNEIPAE